MKAKLRKVARILAEWPLIGRLVRIGVAVIRSPEVRAGYLDLNHRQHLLEQHQNLIDQRQHVFETEQLPVLLQTLAELNHELTSDNDRDNLVKSVPEALRKIRRDLVDVHHRQHVFETEQLPTLLQTLSEVNYRQLTSDNDRDNLVKSVPVALRKITRDLVDVQSKLGVMSSLTEQKTPDALGQIVDSQEKIESLSTSVSYLLGRVEFIRRELMFEMRYSASTPPSDGEKINTETEILSPEKLEIARNNGIRLNLGCGHISIKDYLNVDRRALPGVDIVAEVDRLPFEQGEIDEIFSAHLLEHFPLEQLRRELLPYFFSLLKEGGELRAVVPDAETMIREYSNGQYSYDKMREVIYGAQDYEGDFHFNMFTPESLSKLFLEAGFINPLIIASGRQNGDCYEFEITAVKAELTIVEN